MVFTEFRNFPDFKGIKTFARGIRHNVDKFRNFPDFKGIKTEVIT